MSENTIKVEQLDNGLKAAFVNLPHFRTHSARLVIGSGSLHEAPNTYGSAHFLEHVTFQGTEALPTESHLYDYSEEHGMYRNASTGRFETRFVADGPELEPLVFFINQVAMRPLLATETLERERKPIIDEIRRYRSNPDVQIFLKHMLAVRGEKYAREVTGTEDDVRNLTDEALREYYRRNYRLGNAFLILCSAEPVEKQRKYAEGLFDGLADFGEHQPRYVELDAFNPNNEQVSLELADLPLSAQTSFDLNYALPKPGDNIQLTQQDLASNVLSKAAFNKLRREMAICYGAYATTQRVYEAHFGRRNNWGHLSAGTQMSGEDVIVGLDALYKDVIQKPLSEKLIMSALASLRRSVNSVLESQPAPIADWLSVNYAVKESEAISLEEAVDVAESITPDDIRKSYAELLDSKPLITATSPDPKVLEAVGNWAASRL